MKKRIITGTVLIIVVCCFLLYASKYLFGAGIFTVAILSAYEWLRLAKVSQESILKSLIVFGAITFIASQFFVYLQYVLLIFWLYALFKLIQYERHKFNLISKAEIIIMGLFVVTPFSVSLYILHANGIAWVLTFILVVTAADSGAYFFGKIIGKTRLFPRLSPGKTLEGLCGGLICATVSILICLLYMDLGFWQYISMVMISVIAAILSVIGDLFESMIKRIAGVKDSGNILPGHGGILDRLDGYMPALPVFVMLGYITGVFVI